MILDNINYPKDLKTLDIDKLNILANEIRDLLINRVSKTGGHFGPNLGMIEATIALHYVFNSPVDKFVFDTSHQTYTHKILTGRKEGFINNKVTGFSSQKESEHDFFIMGHTSTSISLGVGLCHARDIKNQNENIVAIIGDGSLSGGQAFEGLSNGGALNSNFIVVVNDNEMSIGDNYGSLYNNLKDLRESNGECEHNLFKSLGYDYLYVEEGNNISDLVEVFKKVKDTNKPVVVHIHTLKGKGYEDSETRKEKYHYTMPFDLETKELVNKSNNENYIKITNDYLINRAKEDKNLVAITAGTPALLNTFRYECSDKFIDVGIAEQHAISIASSMASQNINPVVCLFSSFVQRAYDQLSQDLAINNNPAVVLLFNAGIAKNAETHIGVFDIPLISNIPNIVFMCPTTKEEYIKMLDYSLNQNEHPVVIRVPSNVKNNEGEVLDIKLNKFEKVISGEKVSIIGVGSFYNLGKEVLEKLKTYDINATLINPRFVSELDYDMLDDLTKNHELVITLEDGLLDGGFGEKISRYYSNKDIKVLNFGAKKEFADNIELDVLYENYNLKVDNIVNKIRENLKK